MSDAMTDPTAGPINRTATFHPSRNDDEIPAIEVAGVLVFVYVDATGTLRVSLDFDTADATVFGEDTDGYARPVPVQVALSGTAVYRIDGNGDEHYGVHAEDGADTTLRWEHVGGDQEATSRIHSLSYWSLGQDDDAWRVELVIVDEAGTTMPYGVDLGRHASEDAAKDAAARFEREHIEKYGDVPEA